MVPACLHSVCLYFPLLTADCRRVFPTSPMLMTSKCHGHQRWAKEEHRTKPVLWRKMYKQIVLVHLANETNYGSILNCYTLWHTIENTKENIAWGDVCSDLPICSCYQLLCPDVTRNLSFQQKNMSCKRILIGHPDIPLPTPISWFCFAFQTFEMSTYFVS